MADVKDWTKQLCDQLPGEMEWQVVYSEVKVITLSPGGKITLHNLEYTGKRIESRNG